MQRGKPVNIPAAERHHHWKLRLRDWDGAAVPHGGCGITGSVSTDGVLLCVGLWRPRQHQGQELGSRPTPVHPGPVERAAMANQETPMAPNTRPGHGHGRAQRHCGRHPHGKPGMSHIWRRACRLMPFTSLVTMQCGDANFTVFRTQCRRSWRTSGARMGRAWPSPVSLWWRR
jgi:hypothetical protein